MTITEKEVRRIVSLHFKNRYNMDVQPDKLIWWYNRRDNTMESLIIPVNVVGDEEEPC